MLLLMELEVMVGLVAMMDHHTLHVHFLFEDFQRIAGVQ